LVPQAAGLVTLRLFIGFGLLVLRGGLRARGAAA
jgi:hypothetical protein